jgi:hypothetical protein
MMMVYRTDGTLSEHQNIRFAMLLPAFRSSVSTKKSTGSSVWIGCAVPLICSCTLPGNRGNSQTGCAEAEQCCPSVNIQDSGWPREKTLMLLAEAAVTDYASEQSDTR